MSSYLIPLSHSPRRYNKFDKAMAKHAYLAHLFRVLSKQVQSPGEHRPGGLVSCHQHGQQIITQLVG